MMPDVCLLLAGGGWFSLSAPNPRLVRLLDIAHHLAALNRWVGAGRFQVTVAEHSVSTAVAALNLRLPVRIARLALLHDAHEAYVGDMIAPVQILIPAFRGLAEAVQQAIWQGLEVPPPEPDESLKVQDLDHLVREKEARAIFSPADGATGARIGWTGGCDDRTSELLAVPPVLGLSFAGARQEFIRMWELLRFLEAEYVAYDGALVKAFEETRPFEADAQVQDVPERP